MYYAGRLGLKQIKVTHLNNNFITKLALQYKVFTKNNILIIDTFSHKSKAIV